MIASQVTPEQIAETCGDPPGLVCESVYEWTESELAADWADWIADTPLTILLILILAFVANRLVRRLIRRLTDGIAGRTSSAAGAAKAVRDMTPKPLRSSQPETSLRTAMRARTIGSVLRSVTSVVVWSIATLLILGELGINLAPLLAGAGVVGVALGFGSQSLVKDFLSGMFMLLEDQYGVGDVIDVGEATGAVEAVSLRTTRLRSVDGTVWHVPNGEIRRVGNMSQQWARALIDVQVAYDTDLEKAERLVKDIAEEIAGESPWSTIVLEPPEVWGIEHLGADGIAIRLVIKTQPGEQWKLLRELRRRIKDRFDAEGVEIPFPQRTLWVRRDEGSSIEIPEV